MKKHLIIVITLLFILIVMGIFRIHGNRSPIGPTVEMTPVEVVEQHLDAERKNNWDVWLATLTEEKKEGFKDPDLHKYLISLEVNEIYELTGNEVEQHLQEIINSEKARNINLSANNISFVYVDFSVESDTTKSPFNGTYKWIYILLRTDNESPWLIQEWGEGNGGI